MNEQKRHWNRIHNEGMMDFFSTEPTAFAKEVFTIIPPSSKILELGCGVGSDSRGFVRAGHIVLATDFSEVAINRDIQRYKDISGLKFEALDMTEPLGLPSNNFDVVYARLSLHYFNDEVTRRIFRDIQNVLEPKGILAFMCKSTNDPLYGKGTEIEKDMYEHKGHVRHFFSEEYANSVMCDLFDIREIESGDEKFYGNDSAFVKVIANVSKKL